MDDADDRQGLQFARGIVAGRVVLDVVGLPLQRGQRGVDERGGVLVQGTAFAPVAVEPVAVEDLDLVLVPLEEHTAVAAALPVLAGFDGIAELDVQPHVLEVLLGAEVAAEAVPTVLAVVP